MSRLRLGCGLFGVLLVVVELMPLHEAHGDHWWHHVPGFDLGYGFVGCVAIVLISKKLGAVWLQRPETFYEDGDG